MKKRIVILLIVLSIIISSCATPLAGIKDDPVRYAGKDVRISAVIELEAPMPFMDYSLYRISDDTDSMFLFTVNSYNIGDKIFTKAHVIGITESGSRNAINEVSVKTSDYLIDKGIVKPEQARRISTKIVKLIATLGSIAEGSYFLIEE